MPTISESPREIKAQNKPPFPPTLVSFPLKGGEGRDTKFSLSWETKGRLKGDKETKPVLTDCRLVTTPPQPYTNLEIQP